MCQPLVEPLRTSSRRYPLYGRPAKEYPLPPSPNFSWKPSAHLAGPFVRGRVRIAVMQNAHGARNLTLLVPVQLLEERNQRGRILDGDLRAVRDVLENSVVGLRANLDRDRSGPCGCFGAGLALRFGGVFAAACGVAEAFFGAAVPELLPVLGPSLPLATPVLATPLLATPLLERYLFLAAFLAVVDFAFVFAGGEGASVTAAAKAATPAATARICKLLIVSRLRSLAADRCEAHPGSQSRIRAPQSRALSIVAAYIRYILLGGHCTTALPRSWLPPAWDG